MLLEGKVAIVTGGGRDIGAACAVALAGAGAHVVVNYLRSADAAGRIVAEIEKAGGKAIAVQADVTKAADTQHLAEQATAAFGALDILVHNAGGMLVRKTVRDMNLADWTGTIDLNLTSLFLMVKAALPHMRTGGAIITMASDAGRDGGGPNGVAYATSKGAVMTMTRALARELAPAIRVNALCPGQIDTQLLDRFTSPQARRKVVEATPLGREGTPKEVADAAVFLASDRSSFMTGACVDVNGGVLFS